MSTQFYVVPPHSWGFLLYSGAATTHLALLPIFAFLCFQGCKDCPGKWQELWGLIWRKKNRNIGMSSYQGLLGDSFLGKNYMASFYHRVFAQILEYCWKITCMMTLIPVQHEQCGLGLPFSLVSHSARQADWRASWRARPSEGTVMATLGALVRWESSPWNLHKENKLVLAHLLNLGSLNSNLVLLYAISLYYNHV